MSISGLRWGKLADERGVAGSNPSLEGVNRRHSKRRLDHLIQRSASTRRYVRFYDANNLIPERTISVLLQRPWCFCSLPLNSLNPSQIFFGRRLVMKIFKGFSNRGGWRSPSKALTKTVRGSNNRSPAGNWMETGFFVSECGRPVEPRSGKL